MSAENALWVGSSPRRSRLNVSPANQEAIRVGRLRETASNAQLACTRNPVDRDSVRDVLLANITTLLVPLNAKIASQAATKMSLVSQPARCARLGRSAKKSASQDVRNAGEEPTSTRLGEVTADPAQLVPSKTGRANGSASNAPKAHSRTELVNMHARNVLTVLSKMPQASHHVETVHRALTKLPKVLPHVLNVLLASSKTGLGNGHAENVLQDSTKMPSANQVANPANLDTIQIFQGCLLVRLVQLGHTQGQGLRAAGNAFREPSMERSVRKAALPVNQEPIRV